MPRPNDKIGPYMLVRKLGRGNFGVVWLAEKHTPLAVTKVALKLPNDDDIDLEGIKQEAAMWIEASGHPNVLPIIDADIYDEQVVIVSEYAPDGSLADWLRRHGGKAPSIEEAVEITAGILDGLAHLHMRRIIHRDLKPDNILLQGKTPRLVDFGLARVLKTTGQSSSTSGTFAYMPPEAFDGKRSVQTDVWAVGVILYQLLTGRLPYPQTDNAALIGAILTREPETPPSSIPAHLQKVIKQSLQKGLEQRYKSASEMRQAMRNASQPAPQVIKEAKTKVLPATAVALPRAIPNPTQRLKAQEPVLSLPMESTGANSNKIGSRLLGVTGAILLIVGFFCPIVEIAGILSFSYFQAFQSSGIQVWSGLTILLLGVASLILTLTGKYRILIATGIVSLGLLVFDVVKFKSVIPNASPESGDAGAQIVISIGWGFYVMGVGVVLLIIAGIIKSSSPAK